MRGESASAVFIHKRNHLIKPDSGRRGEEQLLAAGHFVFFIHNKLPAEYLLTVFHGEQSFSDIIRKAESAVDIRK